MSEEKTIKILERLEVKLIKIESMLESILQPTLTTQNGTNPVNNESGNGRNSDPISKLAGYCKISVEQLKDVLDYENEKFILLKRIDGKSSAEKQVNASLCILTAWAKGKDIPWISTLKLTDAIREVGIDTKHLGENITKTDYFVLKGARRAAQYHITTIGWQKGLELLKSLATHVI